MLSKIAILSALFCAASFGQEGPAQVAVDVLPDDCPSGAYYAQNDTYLRCADVARIEILLAQRDFHHAAQELYKLQADMLRQEGKARERGERMAELQRQATETCAQLGRKFDVQSVSCGEPLPQPGGNQ